MPHAGGRPRLYSEEEINDLVEKFDRYISEKQIPIIAEFAYQNKIHKEIIYDYEQFSTLRKICTAKKESQLEIGALANKLNPSMAIFSLKQMGWSDKREVKIQTDDETKEKIKRIFDDKFGGEDSK